MPFRTVPRRAAALAAAVLALAGCRRGDEPAVVGIAWPGSRAARVAKAELDSLAGRVRISWDSVPTDSSLSHQAAQVEQAARLVSNPRVIGVVGHRGSRESLLMAPIFNEAGVPWILSGATSRRLHEAGRWAFMLAPDDSAEGEYIGRFIAERVRARSVTLFYIVDEYGIGLRDGVVASLQHRNIPLLEAVPIPGTAPCDTGGADPYASAVDAAFRRGQPAIVVLAARQIESGCVIRRVTARYPRMPFITGDGILADTAFQRKTANVDSLFMVAFWHPEAADARSRAFVDRFRRATGEMPRPDDALVYDAFMTLAAAIDSAGPDRERVRAWLASLGRGHPPFAGVTGPISFPGPPDRLTMVRVRDGRTVPEPR